MHQTTPKRRRITVDQLDELDRRLKDLHAHIEQQRRNDDTFEVWVRTRLDELALRIDTEDWEGQRQVHHMRTMLQDAQPPFVADRF